MRPGGKMGIPANDIPTLAVEREDSQQDAQQGYQAIFFWTVTVLAALWIDFGAFHRLHNSDSIVPVLVSLFRWTPFYWEQDRLGMLVPLLAIPFRNPLANLLAQSAFNVFCGLAAFFLCARYVVRRAWLQELFRLPFSFCSTAKRRASSTLDLHNLTESECFWAWEVSSFLRIRSILAH